MGEEVAEACDVDLRASGVEEVVVASEGQEGVLGWDDAAAAFAWDLQDIGYAARDEV